ncbi:DNA-binding response regulator [Ktedonobacteria bacterium brp13]|nr:DNA-binding response regulator [Ktedonobacteria bacterium brp13]
MSDVIRIMLADDHLVVRTGLRLMLAADESFTLVGEATNGVMAIELAEKLQPDVILMDLRMPEMDGIEAIKQICKRWPQIAVVILTTYNEDNLMIRALQAGACGYLLKDCTLDTLLSTLRRASQGEMLLPPEIMARILAHASQAIAPPPVARSSLDLTEREREVLAGVAQGERSKEIAARLGISERTVGTYLGSIFSKLGVDSRASAVAVAIKRGLLPRLDR